MNKKLYLEFTNNDDDKLSMSFDNPREDLDEVTVREQMNDIIKAGVFEAKGAKVTGIKKAYIVNRQVTEII